MTANKRSPDPAVSPVTERRKMKISVKADIKQVTKYLNNIQKKQIPYATSQALNDTAFHARQEVMDDLEKHLDRPTPWTKRGVRYGRSTKRKLVATVFFLNDRWDYIKYQVKGGSRTPERKAIPVPVGQRLNQYGNMTKGTITRLLSKPNVFSGEVNGVAGIWERGHYSRTGKWSTRGKSRSTSIRLLVAWVPVAEYQKRFPYHTIVEKSVRKTFIRNFNRRMAAALRTAK